MFEKFAIEGIISENDILFSTDIFKLDLDAKEIAVETRNLELEGNFADLTVTVKHDDEVEVSSLRISVEFVDSTSVPTNGEKDPLEPKV